MPKDKERSFNPAMAQRKAEKQKALKKSTAEALNRRNEKLARRNPARLQRQIKDLKAVEESGQQLRPHDKEVLQALERDLRSVQRAREALGDKAPMFTDGQRGPTDGDERRVLGKRRRDDERHGPSRREEESDSSDTDESVRRIPMPRDTPPPIPHEYLRRRRATNVDGQASHPLPSKPSEVKTVYEAAPDVRNLREEAVSKFIPAAVRMKQQAVKGQGKLLEPEEMDSLEQAGYSAKRSGENDAETTGPEAAGAEERDRTQLGAEVERFDSELRSIQIEEVEDEEA